MQDHSMGLLVHIILNCNCNCKIKITNCSSSQHDKNESLEALKVAIDEGNFCELIFLRISPKKPSDAFIILFEIGSKTRPYANLSTRFRSNL